MDGFTFLLSLYVYEIRQQVLVVLQIMLMSHCILFKHSDLGWVFSQGIP